MSEWTEAAVKAIDRAFYEVVESQWSRFGVDPDDEDGAIVGLLAIQDHEVPAHSRMDLLIAQHATQILRLCLPLRNSGTTTPVLGDSGPPPRRRGGFTRASARGNLRTMMWQNDGGR